MRDSIYGGTMNKACLPLLVTLLGVELAVADTDAGVAPSIERLSDVVTLAYTEQREPCTDRAALKRPFFGDVHVHTRYSLDASTQGTRTTPAQAYEFARGARIGIQPWNDEGEAARSLQLRRPLDFAMVSDHAELIGEVHMCNTEGVEGYTSWQCRLYRGWPRGAFYLFNFFSSIRASHLGLCGEDDALCLAAAKVPWGEMQDAAEQHYDRSASCEFTSFIGYEWTGVQPSAGGNLHRNVVFRNADVPPLPPSYIDGPSAEQLWDALDDQCIEAQGDCDVLAIPHNSNLSAGYMFSALNTAGQPIDAAYAAQRMRLEPLVEIMQHKGDSECFYAPGISRDELCAFEKLALDNIAGYPNSAKPDTGFLRAALSDGLLLGSKLGTNPFQFGIIASTDTHLGAPGSVEEDRFLGHGGAGVPARTEIPPGLPDKLEYNPGGLAVVWAEENSRDAIFAGMRAKETYGTSGPRIVSRFFGGWDYPADLCERGNAVAQGYAGGVPMGGELPAGQGQPRFLVMASQDAGTADSPGMPLDRLQVIKGWIDQAGQRHEAVFDVAGGEDLGASVDLSTCEPAGRGHANLCRVWTDDSFDPEQHAWYYSRAVENPSCRWSQRLCIAQGVDCADPRTIGEGQEGCCSEEHRPLVRERAWSSPIWYRPADSS
ncbi:MAG: DUF3604 domain-containing protein [Pseudomonadota bacterium]